MRTSYGSILLVFAVAWCLTSAVSFSDTTGTLSSEPSGKPEEMVRRLLGKVLTISNLPEKSDNEWTDDFDERQENVVASCFLASKDLIVTARHNVTQFIYPRHLGTIRIRTSLMIYSSADPSITCDLLLDEFQIVANKEHDIALLRFKPTAKNYSAVTKQWSHFVLPIEPVARGPVELGVPVAMIGFAGTTTQRSPLFVFGHLGGYEYLDKLSGPDYYVFDRGLQPGFSGGPIVSLRTGKVVAVATHIKQLAGSTFTWGASNSALLQVIKSAFPDFSEGTP